MDRGVSLIFIGAVVFIVSYGLHETARKLDAAGEVNRRRKGRVKKAA